VCMRGGEILNMQDALHGEEKRSRVDRRSKWMGTANQIAQQRSCDELETEEVACDMQQHAGCARGVRRVR
jgi:hypothetical protein